ncbi:MAG TPA: hypothetical protein VD978_19060 [Azospirillum sp.]|nr:hypothetical protein [Azospirillum sp.]
MAGERSENARPDNAIRKPEAQAPSQKEDQKEALSRAQEEAARERAENRGYL